MEPGTTIISVIQKSITWTIVKRRKMVPRKRTMSHAARDVGVIMGLHVKRIINEPTMAAITYGIGVEKSKSDGGGGGGKK
jgi:hypothetical protein